MNETEEDLQKASLADPFASFKNSWYWSLGMVNLPEFRGKPGEDLEKFLKTLAGPQLP